MTKKPRLSIDADHNFIGAAHEVSGPVKTGSAEATCFSTALGIPAGSLLQFGLFL